MDHVGDLYTKAVYEVLTTATPIFLAVYTMDDSKKVFTKAEDDIVRDLGFAAVQDAATADAVEHNMTLREAFIAHRKAIFWSMALSGA